MKTEYGLTNYQLYYYQPTSSFNKYYSLKRCASDEVFIVSDIKEKIECYSTCPSSFIVGGNSGKMCI